MAWSLGDFDWAEGSALRGLGLTVGEMQAVARRQLAGSIVVAILVVAVTAVIALRSDHFSERISAAAHVSIQQPVFVTPADHVVAAARRQIETP